MTEPFLNLQAVVFDWAGTTVDFGSRAPALVFLEIFQRQDIDISMQQARGPMGLAKREHIATILDLPEVSKIWQQRHGRVPTDSDVDALYADFLPLLKETLAAHSDVIPGIPEMVAECRARGLGIGSTTGYTRELVDVFVDNAAKQGYRPDSILCSEEVPSGRPAPWMLFNSAQQLDAYPMWRVVKVDDTTPGIEAGRNAGCWTVGVTRTGNEVGMTDEEFSALSEDEQAAAIDAASTKLKHAGAQFLVESAADLLPVLDEIEDRLGDGEKPECW
jgi:phosphonoacetaldehyde hydrolase